MLEPRLRPLTAAERRLLRCKARALRSHSGDVGRVTWLGAGIIGVLWLLTLLASDAPALVVTGVWLVVGTGIVLWVRRDVRRDLGHASGMAVSLESALERDEAEAWDIRAERYAELREVEDEGACYAFDLGDGRVVFLVGQAFYPSARFPGLDFSVVRPLDRDGASADMWIEKRGPAAAPARVIPPEVKWEIGERIPGTLEVVPGSLDDLVETLRKRRA